MTRNGTWHTHHYEWVDHAPPYRGETTEQYQCTICDKSIILFTGVLPPKGSRGLT